MGVVPQVWTGEAGCVALHPPHPQDCEGLWFRVGGGAHGNMVNCEDASIQPGLILVLLVHWHVYHDTCSTVPDVNGIPFLSDFIGCVFDVEDWVFIKSIIFNKHPLGTVLVME